MLIEAIGQWYDSATTLIHVCTADGYGNPGALDMADAYPTLQNGQDLVFFVQVASGGTAAGTDTYQFILRGSATTDGTDLSGTTIDLITSPTFTQSGTFCQKTGVEGGLFFAVIPALARGYQYWQYYLNWTQGTNEHDLTIYVGIALRSAMRVPIEGVVQASGVTLP